MITTEDARASIEHVQAVRRDLAVRAECSPAWRFTMATLCGGAFAAQAAPGFIALVLSISCFAAIIAMAIVARRRMGFFVNGYRKGKTRKIAIGLLVIIETIYLTSLWLKIERDVFWAPILGGAVVVPIIFVAMRRWQDTYRSEFESA